MLGDVLMGPLGGKLGINSPFAAGGSGAPSPGPSASNSVQFGAAAGPAPGVAPAAGSKEQNFNLSGRSAVFHINGGEGGEKAGKEAADSFMGQLGTALRGMAGEMGG
jgi:hypothetical protein